MSKFSILPFQHIRLPFSINSKTTVRYFCSTSKNADNHTSVGYPTVFALVLTSILLIDSKPLLMEGETPLSSNVHAEQGEGSVSLRGRILNPNSTMEIGIDPADSDSEISSADSQPLEEESDALGRDEQMEDLSEHAITSSNVPDNLARASTLSLLDRANFMDHITGSGATLGGLTYRCINSAADIQRSTVRRYGPALSKLRKDMAVWIRANPYKFIGILGGISLSALALASPAILGAVGFSALGPVAGSIAAGWQATMGSVAAGSLFSFLQSAAMGGAAMGLFLGVGVLGGAIAVGVGFASVKGHIGTLVEESREPVAALAQNFKGAVGGLVNNFMGLFGKKHD